MLFNRYQHFSLVRPQAHNEQVIKLYKQDRYAEAIPIAEKALLIREKEFGTDHLEVARSLNNLAVLYKEMGNYSKAEPLYKRSLAINEKSLGPDHLKVAVILNNMALLNKSLGDYTKAEHL